MTESLPAFFADFAVSCTVNGVARRGIFDAGSRLGAVGMAGITTVQPTLTLPTADVSANPVGQAVVVNAVSYVVAEHDVDGTGISTLILERA
jgi:hypothetical protein